jgi:hypothetical protein
MVGLVDGTRWWDLTAGFDGGTWWDLTTVKTWDLVGPDGGTWRWDLLVGLDD